MAPIQPFFHRTFNLQATKIFFQRIFAGRIFEILVLISGFSFHMPYPLFFSSVRIYYKEKVNFNGISAYRFETRNDFLHDVGPEYGNECFCIDKIPNVPSRPNGCLYSGAIDLSNCQGEF